MYAAMFSEANISKISNKFVNRYLTEFMGRKIMSSKNNVFLRYLSGDKLPPDMKTKTLCDRYRYLLNLSAQLLVSRQ